MTEDGPMKTLIPSVLLACILSTPVLAARLAVEDPCAGADWLKTERVGDAGRSVGVVTVSGLQLAGIPFVGTEAGISSIRGTVTGDAAVEVISDTEMRAYGWCFSIDGVEPDAMPDQVPVPDDQSEIRWYFGFAHYRDGAWISYCTPTRQARPAYICRTP
jgi:hypothetical protein